MFSTLRNVDRHSDAKYGSDTWKYDKNNHQYAPTKVNRPDIVHTNNETMGEPEFSRTPLLVMKMPLPIMFPIINVHAVKKLIPFLSLIGDNSTAIDS
ncbi:hypothetical protein BpHYR1_050671 [Brachionus plicatilis]|uniref:Uncharacterized protein n=1 Tax=Brachionus plicatilis TaxID=10195 RepID=A0A3M7SLV7_BRAPC|nr:hypothetical protein BpHYR1_050671 [Brachionus plicatilis]